MERGGRVVTCSNQAIEDPELFPINQLVVYKGIGLRVLLLVASSLPRLWLLLRLRARTVEIVERAGLARVCADELSIRGPSQLVQQIRLIDVSSIASCI